MNPNEDTKLIKETEKKKKIDKNINLNKNKKQENKTTNSNEQNQGDKNNKIINLIIILIFLIFISIFLINYFMKNVAMNRFFYLLDNNFMSPSPQPIKGTKYSKSLLDVENICSKNKNFAILRRTHDRACGLFSYYIVHLGCIINFLKHGYIPILEVGSFSNVFTGKNHVNDNPWEQFFNQPCGYTFEEVVKKKNVKVFECECVDDMPDEKSVYDTTKMWNYHHQIQEKYMGVKKEILKEVDDIWIKLFGESKNILGVLMRGTDYTAIRPEGHSIPPSISQGINDTKNMDKKYNYDFIFLATEDNKIRNKFIVKFGEKLKYILPEKQVFYNYKYKNFLTYNYKVFGKMNFLKTYLISMIILSKCPDIITARTSGAAGAFILSKGFRNSLVYYLGEY